MGNYFSNSQNINIPENELNNNNKYDYLVFSGAGIKGISYCGALEILNELNILYKNNILKLKGLAGTSAGSIIAGLLAVGYTPNELKKIMMDIDFNRIVDDKLCYLSEVYNLYNSYGLCEGNYIYNLLGELIKTKTGNSDYTIIDLYNDKQIKLVITGTNVNLKKTIYFNPLNSNDKFKNIPIRTAIRISMGIPFIFEPYLYENDYYIDGGVLDNYPIHVFDDDIPNQRKIHNHLNMKVLGFHIMTPDDYNDINNRSNINGILNYSVSLIDIFIVQNERVYNNSNYTKRTITIITPNIPLTKFNLTEQQKIELFDIGKETTRKYFS